jgi:hypothetical protein
VTGSRDGQYYCTKAVEYFPEDHTANMLVGWPSFSTLSQLSSQLGMLSEELNDFPNALRFLEKAYSINDSDLTIINNLARLYSRCELRSRYTFFLTIQQHG